MSVEKTNTTVFMMNKINFGTLFDMEIVLINKSTTMNIIDTIKNDINNGDEFQYDYEIDGVMVTVLMDYSEDEIQIMALTPTHIFNSWIIGEGSFTIDGAVDELVKFIRQPKKYNKAHHMSCKEW